MWTLINKCMGVKILTVLGLGQEAQKGTLWTSSLWPPYCSKDLQEVPEL